jgi:hypothetical protein
MSQPLKMWSKVGQSEGSDEGIAIMNLCLLSDLNNLQYDLKKR